jgi:hypothetical protein
MEEKHHVSMDIVAVRRYRLLRPLTFNPFIKDN